MPLSSDRSAWAVRLTHPRPALPARAPLSPPPAVSQRRRLLLGHCSQGCSGPRGGRAARGGARPLPQVTMLQTRLLPAPAAKGSTPFPAQPFLPPTLERQHRRCGAHLHLRGASEAWEPPPGRQLPAPEGWSGAATEESRGGGGGQRCTDWEEELGVLVEPARGGGKLALNWQVASQRSLCGSLPDTLSCAHARAHTCAHTHTHSRSAQTPRAHRPPSAQHTRFSLEQEAASG